MSNVVRCGLIQTKNAVVSPAGGTDKSTMEKIKQSMLDKHLEYTEKAAKEGIRSDIEFINPNTFLNVIGFSIN